MVFETMLRSDLKRPVKVNQLTGNMFSADNGGNKITVEILDNGEAATISGSVHGYVIRPDNKTVVIEGTLTDNKASIVLPASAYVIVGQISIVIKVGNTTVGACTAYVYRTTTDTIVDPGSVVPSISELLDKIADCEAATAEANNVNATMSKEGRVTTITITDRHGVETETTLTDANIDDTAGIGDTTKAWSADKTYRENSNLKSALSAYSDNGIYIIPSSFIEQGGISVSGVNAADSRRIRLANKIPVTKNSRLYFTPGTVCTHISYRFYDINGNWVKSGSWSNSTQWINPDQDGFFAFMLKSGDGTGAIIPSQYDAQIKVVTLFGENTILVRGTLTSSDDMDAIEKPGMYWYNKNSKPAHAPSIDENARIFIIKSASETAHSQELQIAITNGGIYQRYTTGAGYTNWENSLLSTMINRGTLTSNDDLDTVTLPGVYFYSYTDKPSHSPLPNRNARVMVIRSETVDTVGSSWQMAIIENVLYYRSHEPSSSGEWGSWLSIPSDLSDTLSLFKTMESSAVYNRDNLTSSDDLNQITKPGVNWYGKSSRPNGAPASTNTRVFTMKSTTESNFSAYEQIAVADGVLYYRDKPANDTELNDWKSVGIGSPKYQEEVLPYNAVLYHAKWDSLIEDRVLRRINLGNVDNDDAYPMYAYEFCPNRDMVLDNHQGGSSSEAFDWTNALYPRPKVLIIGGVHGNEKCTPMDIYKICKLLKTRDYNDIACKFDWYFIPIVNPWGYSHARLDENGNIMYDNSGTAAEVVACTSEINAGIRNNAHGQNINRDWSDVVYTSGGVSYGFQTPELQLIKDYVLGINPDIFIDAHQNHTNKTYTSNLTTICHCGTPVPANGSTDEIAVKRKIQRYLDIANANTNRIMLRFSSPDNQLAWQSCRIWDTIAASTSEHYFAGVTALNGSTVIGNTEHQSIKTPYSICTETSEIAANFSGTSDWYNPVACTMSCTYLWNVIEQMSKLF